MDVYKERALYGKTGDVDAKGRIVLAEESHCA
jgi:hypothetical protein